MTAWSGWVAGSVCGFVLGGFLPDILTQSMGVALYALLLAILLPALKSSRQTVFLAVVSAGLNTLLIRLDLLPAGWTIIVCILLVAFGGAMLAPKKRRSSVNETLIPLIVAMAAVTYIPRLMPLLLLTRLRIPHRVNTFLKAIPVAAIGALIVPGVLTATPELPAAALAGMGFTLVFGLFRGGIIVPVLGAVGVTWLMLAFCG